MEVPGKRKTEAESLNNKNDLSERGLSGKEAQRRDIWTRLIQNIDPTSKSESMQKKKIASIQKRPISQVTEHYVCNSIES